MDDVQPDELAAVETAQVEVEETAEAGYRTLHRCDTGPDVAVLQERLGVDATGKFDAATERAVKRLQRLRGLPQQGTVGPATWPYVLAVQVDLAEAYVATHDAGGDA
jgi:peptidoglycan hydrolase-like protein with peptidoglycan-binding domain